ncbi:hypothetical protein [Fusobacterium nucleatum]|uniref:hypothetical protein n=1 Tax=Fusobacterium nucleatum TaxID=851 RepID=UPI0030D1D76F
MISRINLFNYGEVGERLAGIRESEIHQQSAQKIENFVINEMGNLKIAKKWKENILKNAELFNHLFDTKYDFYIGISNNNIYTIKKDLSQILYKHPISPNYHNFKIADDKLFLIGKTSSVYEFDKNTGNIGSSNFLELLKYPIKDRQDVKIDVYKCYKLKDTTEIRISLLGTYTNPRIKSNNGIYLFETNIKLERLYKQYKTSITDNIIDDATDGMVFGVMHGYFKKDEEKQYLLGNEKVELVVGGTDNKYGSEYFTTFNKNVSGEIGYGELKELKNDIVDIGMFSDRLYIIKDGIFYFSKKGDYFDFKNDTKADSPFFFKPNPINNIFPKIYSSEVGNRMYVTTNKGVYVISAGNIFSSTNYSVHIASEIPCRDKGVLIADNFFYISEEGQLKCVQVVPNQTGYETFVTVNVEKYDIYSECDSIGKLKYDDRVMLVGTKKSKNSTDTEFNSLLFYQALDFNIFRRFTISQDYKFKRIISLDKYLLFQNDKNILLSESKNNVRVAKLKINTPAISTQKGGNYSNDYQSNVERVFVKVLNEDSQAIKGIKINNTIISKIPEESDLFSCFRLDEQFPILNGYEIEVTTNENEKIFEILGIDTKIKVASD